MPMTPKSSDYCPPPQKLAEGGHRDRMPMRETVSIAHWRRVRESKRSPIDQSEALSGALRIAFASHAYNPRESRRRLTTHGAPGSLVDERTVVEVDGGKLVLFDPIILGVLPFGLVAALRQQVHAAYHVAGVEVLRIDPRQERHVLVLGPQCRRHLPCALFLQVIE